MDSQKYLLTQNGYWVEEASFRRAHLFGLRKEGMPASQLGWGISKIK